MPGPYFPDPAAEAIRDTSFDSSAFVGDPNGNIIEMIKGLSASPMPPIINPYNGGAMRLDQNLHLPSASFAAAGSVTWPTANKAIAYPFLVSKTYNVKKLWCFNGSAVSGNVDMAIYTAAFARVVSIGSTAQAGTSVFQEFDIADTDLTPGLYYAALNCDNTTSTFIMGPTLSASIMKMSGVMEQAVGAVTLPNPFVPAVAVHTRAVMFGLADRTLVN